METNISDGAIEFSVKNCIAGESYRFGAKKSPAPASNPEVWARHYLTRIFLEILT